jgi:hypothetical protein
VCVEGERYTFSIHKASSETARERYCKKEGQRKEKGQRENSLALVHCFSAQISAIISGFSLRAV